MAGRSRRRQGRKARAYAHEAQDRQVSPEKEPQEEGRQEDRHVECFIISRPMGLVWLQYGRGGRRREWRGGPSAQRILRLEPSGDSRAEGRWELQQSMIQRPRG